MYKVYLIELTGDLPVYKIGWTKGDPNRRLKQLQTGAHSELYLREVFESKWGSKIEGVLHRTYHRGKTHGEWFELTNEEVINFKKTCNEIHSLLELMWKENTWVKETGRFA